MALLDETPTVGDPGHTEVAHAELARLHNILDGSTKTSNAAQAAAEATAAAGLATKAPLASPAFTGTPTAPTAIAGTNTTQLATTAFVLAVRDALLASAPGALDTLDELAAALGDDANFATTITNALAGKQPIDSDLTAIALLTTTTIGRSLLTAADAAAIRAIAEAQPADSDLTAIAALTTTAYGRALLELANLAALQAVLGTGTPSATTYLRGDGTWATPAGGGGGIDPTVLDPNTVLYATVDNTPAALAMGASTILARLATGDIVAATPAQLRTLLDAATVAQAKTEAIGLAVGDETTAITVGNGKVTYRMPFAMNLTEVRASLTGASSSGIPTVDINEGGVSILSTKLTIDATEKTSVTAAAAAVISDDALADDAEVTIDVDVAGTGATGLKVWLIGTRA